MRHVLVGLASGVKWRAVLPVSIFVAVADQVSKLAILSSLQIGENIPVIPGFFNFTLAFNRGAAFGFLSDVPDGLRQALLGVATIIALGAVAYFLIHEHYSDRIAQTSLAMVIGGAVGNVIDRVRLGHVVDFLDFYIKDIHYPAFNIADSCICIGVVLLFFRGGKPKSV